MNIAYTYIRQPFPRNRIESYCQGLPAKAAERILRYYRWQDAQASVFGWMLLTELLNENGMDGAAMISKVEYDGLHKPHIPGTAFSFNTSHSGKLVACALGNELEVGLDVEEIRPVIVEDFDACWCAEEIEWLYREGDRRAAFYFLWTRKEAIIKACGSGLSLDLKAINVLSSLVDSKPAGNWTLQELPLHPHYRAHLALPANATVPVKTIQKHFS